MEGEPRNAASERWCAEIPNWDDENYVRSLARHQLADDFVREGRRRLVAIPTSGPEGYLRHYLSWFEMGDGKPRMRVAEVLAVRGERLLLSRMTVSYVGGPERETLAVTEYGDGLQHCRKVITFDPDDVDAALAELDRLHAEIEAGDSRNPSPSES